MSYTYQWQDDGAENISGATSSTYTSRASDVGHALDVVVTASNPYGSAQAKSAAVGPVTTPSQNKNCAGTPGSGTPSTANLAACGYPSPDNTGVPSGIALTPVSGDMTITTPGTVVNAMAFTGGTIHVDANNVTIENSSFALSTPSGQAIFVSAGVSGTVVKYCTFHGTDNQSGSLFIGVFNDGGDQLTLDHDQAYWTDDILHGSGTLTNSYSVDDANIPNDHYEPIYYGGGGGSLIVNHDTLLNPHSWTAAVFTKNDFGDIGTVAIANSLLAGGGYTLYGGLSGNNGNVNGPITVVNNRFSRLYYPDSGYWGVDAYFNPAITSWSGNIWDDTLATVGP